MLFSLSFSMSFLDLIPDSDTNTLSLSNCCLNVIEFLISTSKVFKFLLLTPMIAFSKSLTLHNSSLS